MREEAIKDVMESVQNMRANYCMLHTPSMWAFIGLYSVLLLHIYYRVMLPS